MSTTPPAGVARRINRAILTATLAFGAIALAALAIVAFAAHDAPSLVYGLCLAACSLFSFLYNMLERAPRRALLRYLDHAAIFLLIAGTYTPFAAIGIHGPFGVSLLAWIWGLAIAGIALKLILPKAHDRAFVGLYLAMGWLFLTGADEVLRQVPPLSLALLLIGGLAYTIGAVIYARDIGRWTDPVWHSFVLAGAVTHFFAVVALRAASGAA